MHSCCLSCKTIKSASDHYFVDFLGKWSVLICVCSTLYNIIRLLGQVYRFNMLICYPCSSLIGAVTLLLIERAMTFQQKNIHFFWTDGSNIWKRYFLLQETVTNMKELSHSILKEQWQHVKNHIRCSKLVISMRAKMSFLKSIILAILNFLLVTIWDVWLNLCLIKSFKMESFFW